MSRSDSDQLYTERIVSNCPTNLQQYSSYSRFREDAQAQRLNPPTSSSVKEEVAVTVFWQGCDPRCISFSASQKRMELGALSWRFSAGHCCARRIQQSGRAQRCKREMHAVRASDNHSPESALSPLKCAQQMAAYRANQSITSNPVCHDMFAVGLLGNQGENSGLGKSQTMESSEAVYRRHIIATAFLDEQLLRLATMMNLDIQQGYQQIVLVGPGLDTRPFRWTFLVFAQIRILKSPNPKRQRVQLCCHGRVAVISKHIQAESGPTL